MSNSHSEAPRKSEAPRRIWTEKEIKELIETVEDELKPPIVDWKFISSMCSDFYEGRIRSAEACRKKWRELQREEQENKEAQEWVLGATERMMRSPDNLQSEELGKTTVQTGSLNPGERLMWDGKQQKMVVLPPIPWYKRTTEVNLLWFFFLHWMTGFGIVFWINFFTR